MKDRAVIFKPFQPRFGNDPLIIQMSPTDICKIFANYVVILVLNVISGCVNNSEKIFYIKFDPKQD